MSAPFDVITSIVSVLESQAAGHGQWFLNEWYPHVAGIINISDPQVMICELTSFWRTKIACLGIENSHELFNWLDDRASPQAWCHVFAEQIAPNLTFDLTSAGWS